MNRSRSEGAFDEAIAHELMRYSSDPQDLLSLDDALARRMSCGIKPKRWRTR
jgi:hypothetical protein